MDYSPLYVRASNQYLSSANPHGSLTGDFTFEWWWKPASLAAGSDQTFYQVNHSLGGTPVRIWKTDSAGSPRLRLRCQEVGGPAPLAAEHVEVEWDISALVSVSTWVHMVVAFDVSQAVAAIAELYTDATSRGNGSVISGTDCSSIVAGDTTHYIGGDGSGNGVDGRLFDWRMWILNVRTPTEISDNYQLVLTNSATGQMRQNLYKSGQHHENAAYSLSSAAFSPVNGPITFAADIPANMNQSVGTADGGVVYGVVEADTYSSDAYSGAVATPVILVGGGQEYLSYYGGAFTGADASLVDLSGTGGVGGPQYRMRGFDTTLTRPVYWTTSTIDSTGTEYTGPGPLTGIVVSKVIGA